MHILLAAMARRGLDVVIQEYHGGEEFAHVILQRQTCAAGVTVVVTGINGSEKFSLWKPVDEGDGFLRAAHRVRW